MKTIAIIGAGLMTKPIVDYFIDKCKYQVIMADLTTEQPEKIIAGRHLGKSVRWSVDEPEILDKIISEVDIVVSMVPRNIHIHVAKSCLRNKKSMLTASYESPEMIALDKEAKEKGILILNELGEDPGIDHLGTQMLIDEIRKDNGKILSIYSYGCGIPSFEHSNNPMKYKFSWCPRTFLTSSQSDAEYIKNGKTIKVPGDKLFEHFHIVNIKGLGTFEAYPNKTYCEKYLIPFALKKDITFYRGSLRYPGFCSNIKNLITISLFDKNKKESFEEKTYLQFTSSLINASTNNLKHSVAQYLKVDDNSDIINILKWLGFFDDKQISIKEGTKIDVLLDLMMKKMYYQPNETDMIIVHIEIIAEFPDKHKEKRIATMHLEGIPFGDSAMSRAVGLTVAIAAKLILEGKIKATGTRIPPTLPELYKPILEELSTFGLSFKKTKQ